MPSVSTLSSVRHPSLPAVTIFPVSGPLQAGSPQTVLVQVDPLGLVPLHSHTVDAEMYIVAGKGWVCSTDATDGRAVAPGCRVFFEADQLHGFRAGQEGLSFISVNGGIVDEHADHWDYEAAHA